MNSPVGPEMEMYCMLCRLRQILRCVWLELVFVSFFVLVSANGQKTCTSVFFPGFAVLNSIKLTVLAAARCGRRRPFRARIHRVSHLATHLSARNRREGARKVAPMARLGEHRFLA